MIKQPLKSNFGKKILIWIQRWKLHAVNVFGIFRFVSFVCDEKKIMYIKYTICITDHSFAADPHFLNLVQFLSSIMHNWSYAEAFLFLLKPDIHGVFLKYLQRREARAVFGSIKQFLGENEQWV